MTQTATRRVEPDPEFLNHEAGNGRTAMIEVASTRAAQEIQSAMVVAKKFPRDEQRAFQKIMTACKRKSLAESAVYAYPKGGQTVSGPSIRMAEVLAQSWGNIDFGIIELEQRKGESTMMSYAWDLETNARQTKVFAVKHERFTKRGSYGLEDPREIYEMTANQGARRLRACILGIIPGDVVDAAVAECEKTMAGNNTEPLADRIRTMLVAFGEMSVTQEMIETRLGHKAEVTSEAELVGLKKVYRSLRDNMAAREDFFEVAGDKRGARPDPINEKLNAPSEPLPPQGAAGAPVNPPTSQPPESANGPDAPAPASGITADASEDEFLMYACAKYGVTENVMRTHLKLNVKTGTWKDASKTSRQAVLALIGKNEWPAPKAP